MNQENYLKNELVMINNSFLVDKAFQYGFISYDKGIELICDLFTEGSPIRVDVLFDSSCGKGRAI